MAKECKLIHINDGTAIEMENGNRHFVEEYAWTETYLNRYLREGYELKHMVPEVTPAIQRDGSYSFYKSGFTFYLEREKPDTDEPEKDESEANQEFSGNLFADLLAMCNNADGSFDDDDFDDLFTDNLDEDV